MLSPELVMEYPSLGWCPFRIERHDFQAGCILQLGKDTLCYSQDVRPLIRQGNHYFCPLLNFTLSSKTYHEIELLLAPLLKVQDEHNTGINVWPMLYGWSNPKYEAVTIQGKELQKLSVLVREELEKIIYNLT